MFQESHGFNIGHGEFTNVAGDYHQHNTNYAPGVPVNNIGSVTNANFGTNYGTINQTSGGASPPPPPQGGYRGFPGPPPGGYWPPPRPYSEPPPHHASPYPSGGYWNGPRQGPPGPNPSPRQQGYGPSQSWNQEVRYDQYGYPSSQGRQGPNNRPPGPSQQPPRQGAYSDQPQQRQQQFNDRGSRGPSPAPQSDNPYPGGPHRGYSAPANPAPNRKETFDDIYADDYAPPTETQNRPNSSKTKYRNPPVAVESDSDTEMEDAQHNMGNLHISLSATDLTPAPKEKKGFLGLRKAKKAPA